MNEEFLLAIGSADGIDVFGAERWLELRRTTFKARRVRRDQMGPITYGGSIQREEDAWRERTNARLARLIKERKMPIHGTARHSTRYALHSQDYSIQRATERAWEIAETNGRAIPTSADFAAAANELGILPRVMS